MAHAADQATQQSAQSGQAALPAPAPQLGTPIWLRCAWLSVVARGSWRRLGSTARVARPHDIEAGAVWVKFAEDSGEFVVASSETSAWVRKATSELAKPNCTVALGNCSALAMHADTVAVASGRDLQVRTSAFARNTRRSAVALCCVDRCGWRR